MAKALGVLALVALAMTAFAPMALAADPADDAAMSDNNLATTGGGLRATGIALGAAIAILGGAMATAKAQAAIGAGGTGAMAEKPELFGRVFILVALPETMVVLAFVLGIVIAGNI